MTQRTYRAATMAEALAELKKELGRDAVILKTRSVRKGGFLGLGGKPMWEIVASSNADVPRRVVGRYESDSHERVALMDGPSEETVRRLADDQVQPAAAPEAPSAPAATPAPEAPAQLAAEVSEIRRMVESLVVGSAPQPAAAPAYPGHLHVLHDRLVEQDVAPGLAAALVSQAQAELTGGELANPRLVEEKLVSLLAARIPAAAQPPAEREPGVTKARVIALIGPTGVGKTTTIAKLAANFKLREKKRVGLITIDTYRIAAVDQLRTYADIIEVPLRAVLTAGELAQAIQEMRDLDVVLIDTAGRSQNDKLRLNQLASFLAAAAADEIHLVLSATANRRCARNIIKQFGPLGATRVLLTKLDEAETFGMMANLLADGAAALSYVTTGQDVPDDIEPADAVRLAQRIVGGACRAD